MENKNEILVRLNMKGADSILNKLNLLQEKLKDVDNLIKEISSSEISINICQEEYSDQSEIIEELKREILALNNVCFRDDVELLIREGLIAKDKWDIYADPIVSVNIGGLEEEYWYKIGVKCFGGIIKTITRFKILYGLEKQKNKGEIYINNNTCILIEE